MARGITSLDEFGSYSKKGDEVFEPMSKEKARGIKDALDCALAAMSAQSVDLAKCETIGRLLVHIHREMALAKE